MAKIKEDKQAVPARELPPLWARFRVTWTFLTKLCASVPADPEIMKAWIESRKPLVKPAGARSVEEINEEVLASVERGEGEPDQEYSMLVFQNLNGSGLVQRAATVKAHIKDCARVLSNQHIGRIGGERAFSTRVINGVYLDPAMYWLPILRPNGSRVLAADGAYDKPIHVRTPQGQMNAIKRFEYISPPSMLRFDVLLLGKSVSEGDLIHVFSYGGVHGYAGERGDGEGRYEFEIDRVGAAR